MNPIKSSRNEDSAGISRQCRSLSGHDLRQMSGARLPDAQSVSDRERMPHAGEPGRYTSPLALTGSRRLLTRKQGPIQFFGKQPHTK